MARGRIVIDASLCKGCALCVTACPKDVIRLADTFNSKGYQPAVYLDPEHICTGCALCAVVCPEARILVFRELRQQAGLRRPREGSHAQAVA